jgi:GT2 family glycosyltransferase
MTFVSDPRLSIIVVNWNTSEITRNCLASIRQHTRGLDCETILVDNASADDSVAKIRAEYPEVRLIENTANLGFGRANNQAMRIARGRYFLLLNSDTLLIDGSLGRWLDWLDREPAIGISGCKLLFEDLRLQTSCSRFPSLRVATFEELMLYKLLPRRLRGELLLGGYWDHDRERDVDCVWGAAMMVRRDVFAETGGFDERYFMYGEDLEWCSRVRDRGWRVTFTPETRIVHLDHRSSEKLYGDARIDLCMQRYYEIYRERRGTAAMSVLFAVKTAGAALRVAYFGVGAKMREGEAQRYCASQAGFYRRCLRYHVGAAIGGGLVAGRPAADGSLAS